ncbi:hypothetical protein EV652_13120 [Kribbella steppae]|uniref:Uncharacterized protein n=1 Tax=Kribbella steppae TaxID=2512223 RepID=A0A4V2RX71_9ACTN|nr:hypothetical protein [Kribbella steppae]TCO12222.1 hypothetical protein EV652_13120 [Kribbella steppae]
MIAILTVILAGLFRDEPAAVAVGNAEQAGQVHTIGVPSPVAIGVFVGFTLSQSGMVRHWWKPQIPLVALYDERRNLTDPIVNYVNNTKSDTVFVLIPEVEPDHLWQRLLQNQRGAMLAHALRKNMPSPAGSASASPTTSPTQAPRPCQPSCRSARADCRTKPRRQRLMHEPPVSVRFVSRDVEQ